MAGDNVRVFVRVRPPNQKQVNATFIEKMTGEAICCRQKEREIPHTFTFDKVFSQQASQQQVFAGVGLPAVDAALAGFNGTIFAYGQTSSGKTHTCIGPDFDHNMGILPRLITTIFTKIKEAAPSLEFRIKITMVEIYMEKIRDLLDTTKADIKIRENKSKGVYLQEVTEEYVMNPAEAYNLLKRGIQNRAVGSTNMNEVSSRSHMAFIITVYQTDLKDNSAKLGKITLVDLAGSEKVSKSGAEGKLLDEAKQINKSLSSLGNVINALTESKATFVPYRDSKLTRLLQESLGGNSKTNLIINISPSNDNGAQSISSLRFGFRAKQIKNKPKVNKEYTVAELLLLLEKAEQRIRELQSMVGNRHSKALASVLKDEFEQDKPQEQLLAEEEHIENTEQLLKNEYLILVEEKTQLSRQLAIMTERRDYLLKEMSQLQYKSQAKNRENDGIIARYAAQLILKQSIEAQNKQLKSKLGEMEDGIMHLMQLQKKGVKTNSVFGTSKDINSQIERLFSKVMRVQQSVQTEQKECLESKVKEYEQQLSLFKHLDEAKEALIADKLKFMKEREQVYRDLESRVKKIMSLEETNEDLREKIKYYEDLVKLRGDERAHRIVALMHELEKVRQEYYLIKGLQGAWIANTRRAQEKLNSAKEEISKLNKENISIRLENSQLTMKCSELEEQFQNDKSMLDFRSDMGGKGVSNIVKVVRASQN